jgi:hypothetical protein
VESPQAPRAKISGAAHMPTRRLHFDSMLIS